MSDPDDEVKTPPMGIGLAALMRDKARAFEADIATGEICPACSAPDGTPGDGVIRCEDDGGRHLALQCSVCKGEGWCPADSPDLREWYARNARRNEPSL